MERYLTSLYLSLLTYKAGSSNSSYFRVRDHLEEGLTERKCSSASLLLLFQFSSVASDSLQPHRLQQARPPYPSPTPGAYSNPCPSSRWCHPTISSSVIPFSSRLQSFPAQGLFKWVSSLLLFRLSQKTCLTSSLYLCLFCALSLLRQALPTKEQNLE